MKPWSELLHDPLLPLDGGKLDELELLLGGLLAPSDSYVLAGSARAESIPGVIVEVPMEIHQPATDAGTLLLADPDGTPMARLTLAEGSPLPGGFLSGSLHPLQPAEHPPFRRLRLVHPLNMAGAVQRKDVVVAAFSQSPTGSEIAEALSVAADRRAALHLVALIDRQCEGDDGTAAILTELQRCCATIADAQVGLLVVPARNEPAHSEPVSRARLVLDRLGADAVLDFTRHPGGATAETNSSAPADHGGLVVFFTGLSGSGKSTLARSLAERLELNGSRAVVLLDGDHVRRHLSSGLGFSREDRETNIRRIGWVASLIAKSGGIAICAPIAPFHSTRQGARAMAEEFGAFILVHVSTPLAACEQRDRKGLYAKARAGLIPDFTGIDSPYEVPADADMVVDTASTELDASVDALMRLIKH